MANNLVDYAMRARIKTKESIAKIKHGSPKLQEVLRERCRQRMRENRKELFNIRRLNLECTTTENVGNALAEIVRKEFTKLTTDALNQSNSLTADIDDPLNLEEALDLEDEIIAEQEQWILEEYEKMAKDESELLALAVEQSIDQVICPICQKSNVTEWAGSIMCKGCRCRISTCNNVKEFGDLLEQVIKLHSNNCTKTPGFTLIPESTNICLYLVCQTCSSFLPVM